MTQFYKAGSQIKTEDVAKFAGDRESTSEVKREKERNISRKTGRP